MPARRFCNCGYRAHGALLQIAPKLNDSRTMTWLVDRWTNDSIPYISSNAGINAFRHLRNNPVTSQVGPASRRHSSDYK